MDLKDLRRIYHDTVSAIQQTQIIALAAAASLKDFPKNLPKSTRESIAETFRTVGKKLEDALEVKNSPPVSEGLIKADLSKREPKDPVAFPALILMISRVLGGKQDADIDFAPIVYAQSLITTLAHLEAMLGDNLRACCRQEPRLLKRGKQVTWERILEAGGWDAVVDLLIEEYAYEFGWKNIRDKVSHFGEELGATVLSAPACLNRLEEAERIRHLVIHNGGRANADFIRRTGRSDLRVGDPIPVSEEYASDTSMEAVMLCGDVYIAVASQFFGATGAQLTGVLRRTPS